MCTGRASPDALFFRCMKAEHVDQGAEDQVGDAPQVRGSASQPLPPLRASPRLLSEVWSLSHLLPEPGQSRPDSRSEEGELVALSSFTVQASSGPRARPLLSPEQRIKTHGRPGPAETRSRVCMSCPAAPTWPALPRVPLPPPRDSTRYPRRFRKASPP